MPVMLHSSRAASTLLLLAALAISCTSPTEPATDSGRADGGTTRDAHVDAEVDRDASGSGDPEADAGSTDGGTTDAGRDYVVLSNVPDIASCSSGHGIAPLIPAELGHYAAARLTPPSYPFTVDQISYDLVTPPGAPCNAEFAHEVRLVVSDTAAPSASPSTDGTLVAVGAGSASGSTARTMVLDLETSITLTAGQHLFVSIQLTGDADSALCVGACQTGSPISDVDYWSNAAAEPYSWADMIDDFGFPYNFTTRARGYAM